MSKETTIKNPALADDLLKANSDIAMAVIRYELELDLVRSKLREAGLSSDEIDTFVKERIAVAKSITKF